MISLNTSSAAKLSIQVGKAGNKKLRQVIRDYDLYLIMLLGLLCLFIFKYIPMYGATIAFKDFNLSKGILGSDWVGFKHFNQLFQMKEFYKVLRNTLIINLYKYTFSFAAPIVLALMMNELRNITYKRTIQTIVYLPRFISWVVASGMLIGVLSPDYGIVNQMLGVFGIEPVFFLGDQRFFRGVLVVTEIWKEAGFGTIIYLASLAGIDPQLYEAAIIDGAGKWRQLWHITLPGISSTIVVLMILSLGYILDAGHEQILVLYSPMVYEVGDVITTYVYRKGIGQMQYSFTSAVGLFMSVVGFLMIVISNKLAGKFGEGVWHEYPEKWWRKILWCDKQCIAWAGGNNNNFSAYKSPGKSCKLGSLCYGRRGNYLAQRIST